MKAFLSILFLTIVLTLQNCKKKCNEVWSIKGRLLNGTTLQPIKNVWFSADLYDLDYNRKADNIVFAGKAITDDSGYFNIEYKCKEKTYEKIDFETLSPYGGYVRDNVKFEKHFNRTFYYATKGSVEVYIKPKTPLSGKDTLFIEMWGGNDLYKRDSFITNKEGFWYKKEVPTQGGVNVYAARSRKQLQAIKDKKIIYQKIGWWSLDNGITGDPVINRIDVEY